MFDESAIVRHLEKMNRDELLTEEEEENLTLGDDYFSYALFAFYLFDKEDRELMNVQTRFTEGLLTKKDSIKLSVKDAEETNHFRSKDLERQYLRYARRIFNINVFYKMLFLFMIEASMILFVILYYLKWGVDDACDYGTISLKYCCIIALHLMQ